MNNAISIERL